MPTNPVFTAIAPLLNVFLAPLQTALTAGQINPQAFIQNLQGLAISSLVNIPNLENAAFSEGCTLGLDLLAKVQALVAQETGTSASTAAASSASSAGN